jgi:hypothetical protein
LSRRQQIRMSEEEVSAFLAQERVVTCATIGPRGWPHLMPLWYVLREPGGGGVHRAAPRLWSWTYSASQKAVNLRRDHRATLQVENGELYHELRGVMLECEATVHSSTDVVAALGREIFRRYAAAPGEEPVSQLAPEVEEMVARQAPKRVAIEFVELRRATWDHRKLGGAY